MQSYVNYYVRHGEAVSEYKLLEPLTQWCYKHSITVQNEHNLQMMQVIHLGADGDKLAPSVKDKL